MPAAKIDWILIKKYGPEPIGAVGFIGNDAAVVIGFYDDRDGNKDGEVSAGEWIAAKLSPISYEGSAVVEVAKQAVHNPLVTERDPTFRSMANTLFMSFARGMIIDGIYASYFKRGVSMAGGGIAKRVTDGMVKEFVVKKGFETAVKEVFMTAADR